METKTVTVQPYVTLYDVCLDKDLNTVMDRVLESSLSLAQKDSIWHTLMVQWAQETGGSFPSPPRGPLQD